MSRYDALMDRLTRDEWVVLDGATGTELERRGVPKVESAWNCGGALSHPEIVRQVHRDYLEAGAEIVISNTFATARQALRAAGLEVDFDPYNRRGVELAIEARDASGRDDALVAGGVSYWQWAGDPAPASEVERNAADQASIMAEAGADLIMLEMMIDIERMEATISGVEEAGLPIWVGLTCGREDGSRAGDDDVVRLRNGDPLADAVAAVADRGLPVVSIMHTSVELIDECLAELAESWNGVTGVYAHSGDYVNGDWVFDGVIGPGDHTDHARRWIDAGVQVIGGCCGIGVEHIVQLEGLRRP